MRKAAVAAFTMLCLAAGTGAFAQSTAPVPAPSGDTGVSAGIEVRRDRFSYHFVNASTFDTPEPVPHYFDQRYDADNVWLSARVRYRVGGRIWQTEAALTPRTTGWGEDYDTFLNPDGDVIVYGTTAVTDVRSWRVAHAVEIWRRSGIHARVGYQFRRDTSDFRPSYTTIARTQPPSSLQFWNADRETTISELHEVCFGAGGRAETGNRWMLSWSADVAPITLARLTTLLPDKYPGQPIVFIAKALSVETTLGVGVRAGSIVFGLTAGYVGSWSYSSSSQFGRTGLGVRLSLVVAR